MTVQIIRDAHEYVKVSSDVMPDAAPEGSICHVVDTGEELVCHEGVWSPDLRRAHAMRIAMQAT